MRCAKPRHGLAAVVELAFRSKLTPQNIKKRLPSSRSIEERTRKKKKVRIRQNLQCLRVKDHQCSRIEAVAALWDVCFRRCAVVGVANRNQTHVVVPIYLPTISKCDSNVTRDL